MSRILSSIGRIVSVGTHPRSMPMPTLYTPSIYLQALRIERYHIPKEQILQLKNENSIPVVHYCEQSIAVLDCLGKKKKKARKKQIRRKGNKIINARHR